MMPDGLVDVDWLGRGWGFPVPVSKSDISPRRVILRPALGEDESCQRFVRGNRTVCVGFGTLYGEIAVIIISPPKLLEGVAAQAQPSQPDDQERLVRRL